MGAGGAAGVRRAGDVAEKVVSTQPGHCPPDMSVVHHESVYFSGRVQGVGFRYQTLQLAKGFEVSGFVRNLPDGRVHLEAEGEKAEVEAFVAEIEEHLQGYIRKVERTSGQRAPHHRGFAIR